METGSDTVIEVEGLTKHFGPVVALEDLSLQVPRGGVLGLLGPNGSGKTTTMGMLLGQFKPTSSLPPSRWIQRYASPEYPVGMHERSGSTRTGAVQPVP